LPQITLIITRSLMIVWIVQIIADLLVIVLITLIIA
jgi:hypothetical protein